MLNQASLISLASLSILGLNVASTQANPTNIQISEPSVIINGDDNNVTQTTYQYILNNPGRGIIKRNETNVPQGRNNHAIPESGEKGSKEWGMNQSSQHDRGDLV